jgi:hypothetical protein
MLMLWQILPQPKESWTTFSLALSLYLGLELWIKQLTSLVLALWMSWLVFFFFIFAL